MSPAQPQRQRRKEARPQELLDAALGLFVEKGFAATRSEEVAARAGVSKGTLYLYYPSKEELLKAVVRENLSGLIAEGSGIVDHFEGSASDLVALLLNTWWDRVGESPASGIFKIIITEVGNFPDFARFYVEEVIEPAHVLFEKVLQRGIDAGEFRPVRLDDAVHVLIFPLLMLCLHKHSLGTCRGDEAAMDPRRFIATHVDVVLRGLQVAQPGPKAVSKRAAQPQ
ncbi:TetR/AcrR family transcriptional regulator [Methylibium rhizosphaerae]|jgi:AcrR family transcriptional regulator|uniref:TetR/AcrR family transcriptional regulator n=1 Tax=Methylibium rhizosphaerae TaxID=2570323 RepID=UPI00112D1E45|nr:TetR/AcrR family transcriptional regulator [Methylibium rhizosphaerae]